MIIVLATTNELERLSSFARQTYGYAFGQELGEERLEAHLKENMSDDQFSKMMQHDSFYLAIEEDQLIGFSQIGSVELSYREYVENFDAEAGELRRLYVLSTHQGSGVGSALLKHSFQDSFVRLSNTTYLTTWETNHGAQALYGRHGFEKVGAIPEYRSDGSIDGYEHIMARPNPDAT